MTLSSDYARALRELVVAHPEKSSEYLSNLRRVLAHRGHEKLLPRILADYQALDIKEERSKRRREATPEQERTRILLELYRKLITTTA